MKRHGRERRLSRRMGAAILATLAYTVLAIGLTWPLARGLGRDVPGDLGDPLLNMWILSWDGEQLRRIAAGELERIPRFFDANIFHPAPLTLAYSEHLFAQAMQALPVYLASANPILCYNLVFLSTFALSGLGMFALVRELTGSARAAFIAGLLFAFAPYRWSQLSHVQVLSAQWMPCAVFGFRRYFSTGRRRALAGGAAALTLQNLSCGYFLLYFAPLAGAYVLWEIASRRRWRDRNLWIDLAAAGLVVSAITWPFLLPYSEVRNATQLSRDINETIRYSADTYSYLTAFNGTWPWGQVLRAYPKPEGDLFPGSVPLLLAVVALVGWFRPAASRSAAAEPGGAPTRLLLLIAMAGTTCLVVTSAAVFTRRIDLDFVLFSVRATNITRPVVVASLCAAALLWLSPPVRARAARLGSQPEGVFLCLLAAAWWLSLGPSPRVLGRPLELWSPYRLLFEFVPGFNAVRAPARFAMIVAFALSVLAGLGAARVGRTRAGALVLPALAALFVVESHVRPFPLNGGLPAAGSATSAHRIHPPALAPEVYRELARLPAGAVLLEMPLGDPAYDVRAVYYSTVHWQKLVNGYSGFFPPHYPGLIAMLSTAARGDDIAQTALQATGATHVLVHESAYLDDERLRLGGWLRRLGAAEVLRRRSDVLYALRR